MELEIPEATEAVPCPLCGGRDGIVVGKRGRFGMPVRNVCCSECATVYVTPRPTADAMAEYYRSTYRKHYGGVAYVSSDGKRAAPGEPGYEAALFHWHSPQADNSLLLAQTPAGATVLEIGCRHGKTLALMKERRHILPFGIEPGESEAAEARSAGIDCFTGPLEAFVSDRRFDQVQCFHVLEHVHDPLAALMKIRGLLKPDGKLLIEVPNVYQPYGLLEENFFQNVHLVSYSPHSLSGLVRRAGFEVERVVEAGTLFLLARPASLPGDLSLPLPYDEALLSVREHDSVWLATRLGSYANLEKLTALVQSGHEPQQLTALLLKVLSFPCFPEHMITTCALFIDKLVAVGGIDHAVAITIAVAQGPHPSDVRAQFKTFAERMGAPPEALAAAG
jgi:SAM-dependent methyltransferase